MSFFRMTKFMDKKQKWIDIVIFCTLAVILLFPYLAQAAEVVIQTGIASPQTRSEENNVEKLRERAIHNALDLAMLQVTGAVVSSERGNTIRSREDITISDESVSEETKQQSRFHGTQISRTTGHARLLEIIKEWKEGEQYYVNAKIEVGQPEDSQNKVNAGFFWERAGKPSINLAVTEKSNGRDSQTPNAHKTLIYFRDNMLKNGILLSTDEEPTSQYSIQVAQVFQTAQMTDYGTFTTNCELSFEIRRNGQNILLSEYRATGGPNAGFTESQAQDACVKALAQDVSDKMIRNVATIMNDLWKKGIQYKVTIIDLPNDKMTEAGRILENLFLVSSHGNIEFKDDVLRIAMTYKGRGVDLAEAIRTSFDELDWKVVPEVLGENNVQLRWMSKN